MAEPIRFTRYSSSEAARHASYLVVSTVLCSDKKCSVASTIEWRTSKPVAELASVTADNAAPPAPAVRVRILAEREPLTAAQARVRAEQLALRYQIPVILTITP